MKKPVDDSYHPPAPNFYANRGEVLVTRANLPHWNKALTCCFATFRLVDSLPREELLKRLERKGFDLSCEAVGRPLPRDAERGSALPSASSSTVEDAIQDYLDAGHGSCVLRDERCRQIVEDALWHFAGERYHLYAYVVMPNHVHVLFQPTEGRILSDIVAGWKKFTARQINDALGREGSLWQKESFDTLVRSERHFQDVVRYIKKNDLTGAWVAYR